jgi:urease accessory protein
LLNIVHQITNDNAGRRQTDFYGLQHPPALRDRKAGRSTSRKERPAVSDISLRVRCASFAASFAMLALADAAAAHTGTGLAGGLSAGLLHPFAGVDHLLAMIAVGLWGAVLGRPLVVALPVIFPAVMAIGGVLGIVGVPLPPVEIGIAISVLVLGSLIAGAVRAPVWLACVITALFAIFHGYAHGQELPSAADPVGYSLGFVLATGLLHVLGIGLGLLNTQPAGVTTTRTMGGAIAAVGLWFLAMAVQP